MAFVFFDYSTCQPLVSVKRKQDLVSMRNEEDLEEVQLGNITNRVVNCQHIYEVTIDVVSFRKTALKAFLIHKKRTEYVL